ncbi:Ergosterol28 isoform 1 [Hibiscus syriacus]|uniref:Ergosterol28 isoform 1 n=1 Tax=Hibiscus syriacus TaxID=106335 RepID=A0A6A2WV29_HIBSY|nr:Ergosterol28 isoform 1 [Hibiscus syriacus]
MDPCPFVRLTVGNLALKIPVASRPALSVVHPSSSPCFCKIMLKNFPLQTAAVPCIPAENQFPDKQLQTLDATFHLSKVDIDKLAEKSIFSSSKPCLKIAIYIGRRGTTCGVNSGRLLGKVSVPLDLAGTEVRACVFLNGWISVGKETNKSTSAQFHLNVKAEPDPRFVFQYSVLETPVVGIKDPESSNSRSWLSSFGSERERLGKERKGWSITVHDLSGSPVAAASMVTPFVASPGSDRVSHSNPGSWLILRPGGGTWKPWGRLEAWRERGSSDGLGYRFELIPDMSAAAIVLAESTLSSSKGGKFVIDLGAAGGSNGRATPGSATWPACSPRGSGDFGYGLWPFCMYRGFVMSARVEGEGKCSKPCVEVSVAHVSCTEDAAVYVALSAAVDLSIDACRLFSQRLRKELCNHQDLLG